MRSKSISGGGTNEHAHFGTNFTHFYRAKPHANNTTTNSTKMSMFWLAPPGEIFLAHIFSIVTEFVVTFIRGTGMRHRL
jgi:hypothetical protein